VLILYVLFWFVEAVIFYASFLGRPRVSLALEMIDLILFFVCTTGVLCSNLVFLSTSL
jgi:hypothetical protein